MESRRTCPKLLLVVPCYNEEQVLPETAPLYLAKVHEHIDAGRIAPDSGILYVNDGSSDATWQIIRQLSQADPAVRGLCLSRNRGHQNALLAGLMEARSCCNITISIDADGQDDINAVDDMLAAYAEGCDVVYGVRNNRDVDTAFKRNTAQGFYRFISAMGVESVSNHADYRLLSKRVLDELARYEEVNLYLRGMVPLVGFKSTSVYYQRKERMAGESHYPLSKMVGLAVDGITSMSIKPIRLVSGLGFVVAALSVVVLLWSAISHFAGRTVSGWTSLIGVVSLLGGVQLLSLGIIGEYVGKTYLESKHRPRWSISERIGLDDPDAGLGNEK